MPLFCHHNKASQLYSGSAPKFTSTSVHLSITHAYFKEIIALLPSKDKVIHLQSHGGLAPPVIYFLLFIFLGYLSSPIFICLWIYSHHWLPFCLHPFILVGAILFHNGKRRENELRKCLSYCNQKAYVFMDWAFVSLVLCGLEAFLQSALSVVIVIHTKYKSLWWFYKRWPLVISPSILHFPPPWLSGSFDLLSLSHPSWVA